MLAVCAVILVVSKITCVAFFIHSPAQTVGVIRIIVIVMDDTAVRIGCTCQVLNPRVGPDWRLGIGKRYLFSRCFKVVYGCDPAGIMITIGIGIILMGETESITPLIAYLGG